MLLVRETLLGMFTPENARPGFIVRRGRVGINTSDVTIRTHSEQDQIKYRHSILFIDRKLALIERSHLPLVLRRRQLHVPRLQHPMHVRLGNPARLGPRLHRQFRALLLPGRSFTKKTCTFSQSKSFASANPSSAFATLPPGIAIVNAPRSSRHPRAFSSTSKHNARANSSLVSNASTTNSPSSPPRSSLATSPRRRPPSPPLSSRTRVSLARARRRAATRAAFSLSLASASPPRARARSSARARAFPRAPSRCPVALARALLGELALERTATENIVVVARAASGPSIAKARRDATRHRVPMDGEENGNDRNARRDATRRDAEMSGAEKSELA